MPVHLTHASWLDFDKGCGNSGGCRKLRRIDDTHLSPFHFNRFLPEQTIAVVDARTLGGSEVAWHFAIKDIALMFDILRQVREGRFRKIKVLREHLFGSMGKPVTEQESLILREMPVV